MPPAETYPKGGRDSHLADEVLTQRDQKILLRQFEEREAKEIRTGVYEKYLKIAEELENDNR